MAYHERGCMGRRSRSHGGESAGDVTRVTGGVVPYPPWSSWPSSQLPGEANADTLNSQTNRIQPNAKREHPVPERTSHKFVTNRQFGLLLHAVGL